MLDWFRSLFRPEGFTLLRADGKRHNRIRGDLIPSDALVIEEDGIAFNRTGRTDEAGFAVYQQGHGLFRYVSMNE